jgi:zinc-binding in reverse transcriptase
VPIEAHWTRNAAGHFTTKSAYKFIADTPHVQEHYFRIWEVRAPTRVQIFIWLVMQNRILTIDNLIKTECIMINMYYPCREHSESIQHLLNDCIFTRSLRSYIASAVTPARGRCTTYTSSSTR